MFFFRKSNKELEEKTIPVVDPVTAVERAICVFGIVARAEVERDLAQSKVTQSESPDNTRQWMIDRGLWAAASAVERELLERPHGSWTKQEIADCHWRKEALAALVWAVDSRYKLAPYDIQAEEKRLQDRGMKLAVASARLRQASEIATARKVAELWLWRARTTQLQWWERPYPMASRSTKSSERRPSDANNLAISN